MTPGLLAPGGHPNLQPHTVHGYNGYHAVSQSHLHNLIKRLPEHVVPGRLSTNIQDYTVLHCVLQLETVPLSFEGHFFMEHSGKTKTPILALRNLSPLLPAHQSVVKCLSQLTAEQSVFRSLLSSFCREISSFRRQIIQDAKEERNLERHMDVKLEAMLQFSDTCTAGKTFMFLVQKHVGCFGTTEVTAAESG